MWFRKLQIVNVGPFEDRTFDLTRGSIGIFGRNGQGKSTLVNLMYGALTNDFSRFDGLKEDMIRNTADPKARSYVSAVIQHGDVVLDVTRNFRTTKTNPGTVLTITGGTTAPVVITDNNKANAEIYATLGVEKKLIDLYVFKQQHEIYDFLTTIPSERAKAYQVLCRTEGCERAWEAMGQFLAKDKEASTEIVDNSDELNAAIGELKEQLVKLGEREGAEREKMVHDKYLETYRNRVRKGERRVELEEDRHTADAELSAAQKDVRRMEKAVAAAQETFDELKEKHKNRQSKADDTRAALRAWEAYRQYRRRRKQLQEEQETLASEGKKRKPPQPVEDADKLRQFESELATAEAGLARSLDIVELFRKTGRTECPKCGMPAADMTDHIAEHDARANTLRAEISRLEAKCETIRDYREKAREYEKWKAGHDARVKANADSLGALKSVEAPDGTEDELKEWLEKFDALVRKYQDAATALSTAQRQHGRGESDLEAAQRRVADIAQKIEENTVEPEKIAKAIRRLKDHDEAVKAVAALKGEARGLKQALDGKEDELKRLRVRLKRTRRVRAMVKLIEQARDVLHRDRLPKRVATTNLARMEGDINEGLAAFGEPFWVEADDNLSFVVHKPGQPPHGAGRLSTGQRVVLALSFWPAVASLWAADLGMLALDEPTANLDADNRRLLRDALGALSGKVRGQRQLVMVSHDPDLRSAFDQVIDLGG